MTRAAAPRMVGFPSGGGARERCGDEVEQRGDELDGRLAAEEADRRVELLGIEAVLERLRRLRAVPVHKRRLERCEQRQNHLVTHHQLLAHLLAQHCLHAVVPAALRAPAGQSAGVGEHAG
eukprot:366319-Chlamydomonas_euryale.AAC.3